MNQNNYEKPKYSEVERLVGLDKEEVIEGNWESYIGDDISVIGSWLNSQWEYTLGGYDVSGDEIKDFLDKFSGDFQGFCADKFYMQPLKRLENTLEKNKKLSKSDMEALYEIIIEFSPVSFKKSKEPWYNLDNEIEDRKQDIDKIAAFIAIAKKNVFHIFGKF